MVHIPSRLLVWITDCTILTGAVYGIGGYLITVEVDMAEGLPCIDMVGFLGSEVKESAERVRVAIKNGGYVIPPKRFTINLSPAGIRKGGSAFDLPIAIGIGKLMKMTYLMISLNRYAAQTPSWSKYRRTCI